MLRLLLDSSCVPLGYCFQWQTASMWLNTASDIVIGLVYCAIPVAAAWLVTKRRELTFGWMFWLSTLFFLAGATTRFMVLWAPDYDVQSLIKAVTALISILTAILLWRSMSKLLTIPTPGQLQRVIDQLSSETAQHERTVERLHRTEESFQLLVESVRDCAMFMLDTTGRVTSWNAGAQHIKHYRADEIVGRHFACFYTAEDQAAGKPMRALETASSVGIYQEEGWRVRKDGTLFVADVVINPILDRGGALVGFAEVTRDITRRKQAETELDQAHAALAQSQKMDAVGQLTGGIAHDFNNMLTAILGSVDLLESRQNEFSLTVNRMLGVIHRAAERGADLTGRLLAFSRKEALDPAVIDINRLVSDMAELLRRALGESISIETILAKDLWPSFVDPNQVESALLNLAINARDAMHQGGKLTIETGNVFLNDEYARRRNDIAVGEYVFIAVTDTGTGMTPEVMEHAFEPFYTTKKAGHGTGLGLSQVYGFVKQSSGSAEISSEVGRGTTVRMYFPRTAVLPRSRTQNAMQGTGSLPRGTETILVVEDDEDVRGYAVNAIRHLGYKALEASDATNALALLEARSDVRLLFTDVGLPGMNGHELAGVALATRTDLRVVFTSGYARAAIVSFGLPEQGVHLLPKPFRIESLAHMLRSALDAA